MYPIRNLIAKTDNKERYHASYQQDDDLLARVMKTELEQFQSAGRYHGRNCEEKVNSAATGLATPMSKRSYNRRSGPGTSPAPIAST